MILSVFAARFGCHMKDQQENNQVDYHYEKTYGQKHHYII